jgi:hypothetical protein
VKVAVSFAAFALLPAMTGPLAAAERRLEVSLCSGDSLSIPLRGAPAPDEGPKPCCAKGCHSSSCRKRFDRAQ